MQTQANHKPNLFDAQLLSLAYWLGSPALQIASEELLAAVQQISNTSVNSSFNLD